MSDNFIGKDATGTNVTFDSKDIGSGVQRPRHEIASAPAGAITDIGNSSSTAAIITDTAGTVIGFLRGLVKLWITRLPAALGQAVMSASLPVVIASDQSSIPVTGTVLNGGPAWTQTVTTTSSADMSSVADITPAPVSGEHTVVESVVVSAGTAMIVTIKEETTNTVLHRFNLGTNGNAEWNPANGLRLPSVNKKLRAQASVSGQVDITVISHSAS